MSAERYGGDDFDLLMERIKASDDPAERERLLDEAYELEQQRSGLRCYEDSGAAAQEPFTVKLKRSEQRGGGRGDRRDRSPRRLGRGRRGISPDAGRFGRPVRRRFRGRSVGPPALFGRRRRGLGFAAPLALGALGAGAIGLGLGAALALNANDRYDYRYSRSYDEDYDLYLIRNLPSYTTPQSVVTALRAQYPGLRVRLAGVRRALRDRPWGRRGRIDVFIWIHRDDLRGRYPGVLERFGILDWRTLGNSPDVVQDYDNVVF